ncbi:MAG: glycosyltransferase family 4 protein [Nonlabens sp.]
MVEGLKQKQKIQAVSAAELPVSERENGVFYHSSKKFSLSALWFALSQKDMSFKKAYRFYKKYDYIINNQEAIFHFHNLQNINDELLDYLIHHQIKYVLSLRGYDVTIFPLISNINEKFLEKRLRHSWKIHSVCNSLVDNASTYYSLSKEKAHVIYRTPNLKDVFDFKPKSTLGKEINIFTISRVHWKKCIAESLISIKKLIDQGFNVNYHVIGGFQGDEKKRLLYIITKLGLQNNVVLHGYQPEDQFKAVIAGMDICWIPTINEGLPNTIYFLLKSGVPTIASSTDGIPEVIKDGINGLLFSPYNFDELTTSTINLLKNSELRLQLSNNARNTELQNIESEVEQYINMYEA